MISYESLGELQMQYILGENILLRHLQFMFLYIYIYLHLKINLFSLSTKLYHRICMRKWNGVLIFLELRFIKEINYVSLFLKKNKFRKILRGAIKQENKIINVITLESRFGERNDV